MSNLQSDEAKQRIKQTTENKEMKNKAKTIAKYTVTVIATLAVVAGLYALYNIGVQDGKTQQKRVSQEIATQVALKLNQK